MDGIQDVDAININMHKSFLHTATATFLWTRHQSVIKQAMRIDPVYLKPKHKATEFRHWGIPLSRRARCLKTWFILRTYGVKGMQEYIRRVSP